MTRKLPNPVRYALCGLAVAIPCAVNLYLFDYMTTYMPLIDPIFATFVLGATAVTSAAVAAFMLHKILK